MEIISAPAFGDSRKTAGPVLKICGLIATTQAAIYSPLATATAKCDAFLFRQRLQIRRKAWARPR